MTIVRFLSLMMMASSNTTNNPTSTNHSNADKLTIGVVQTPLRPSFMSPLDSAKRVEQILRSTASLERTAESVDMFVLPELCPIGYSEETFGTYLQPIIQAGNHENVIALKKLERVQAEMNEVFSKVAIDLNCYICFGSIGIIKHGDDVDNVQFTIRQLVIGPDGREVTHYDKIHLCNYGDCSESRFFTAGSVENLSSFHCRGFQVGITICADIRNPILYQRLVSKHNVDLLLQPAAFSRDLSFPTWKSFRVTRAVENSSYFCGVNYSGEDYGESSLVGPWVDDSKEWEPSVMGIEEGVMVKSISRRALDHVRQTMPFHRRLLNENL